MAPGAGRRARELVPRARIPVEPTQQLQVPALSGERAYIRRDPGAPGLPSESQEVRAAPEARYGGTKVIGVTGQAALEAPPQLGGRGVRCDPARGGRARRPGLSERPRHGGEEKELVVWDVFGEEAEDVRVGHGGARGLHVAGRTAFFCFSGVRGGGYRLLWAADRAKVMLVQVEDKELGDAIYNGSTKHRYGFDVLISRMLILSASASKQHGYITVGDHSTRSVSAAKSAWARRLSFRAATYTHCMISEMVVSSPTDVPTIGA